MNQAQVQPRPFVMLRGQHSRISRYIMPCMLFHEIQAFAGFHVCCCHTQC